MTRYDVALGLAGLLGSAGAVIHGLLTQWHIVTPVQAAAASLNPLIQRLVPVLLHVSTFTWAVGGLALIGAALVPSRDLRFAIGLLVGSSYLFASCGNLWASHGRHPGWIVYGLACALIVYGLTGPRP